MNSTNRFSNQFSLDALDALDAKSVAIADTQARLEQLLKSSPSLPQPDPRAPWYQRLGQWLLTTLTDSQQVRVWTKITPNGTQWNAYDPATGRRFSGYSEADLRTWLERRYYNG